MSFFLFVEQLLYSMLDLGCVFLVFRSNPPSPPKKKRGKKFIGSSHAQNLDLSFCWQIVYIYSVCFFCERPSGHHGWSAKNHAPQTFGFKLCCPFLHPFAGSHGISLPTVAGQRRMKHDHHRCSPCINEP